MQDLFNNIKISNKNELIWIILMPFDNAIQHGNFSISMKIKQKELFKYYQCILIFRAKSGCVQHYYKRLKVHFNHSHVKAASLKTPKI